MINVQFGTDTYIETLSDAEGNERSLNLTYAVRDGIICHCGEVDEDGHVVCLVCNTSQQSTGNHRLAHTSVT